MVPWDWDIKCTDWKGRPTPLDGRCSRWLRNHRFQVSCGSKCTKGTQMSVKLMNWGEMSVQVDRKPRRSVPENGILEGLKRICSVETGRECNVWRKKFITLLPIRGLSKISKQTQQAVGGTRFKKVKPRRSWQLGRTFHRTPCAWGETTWRKGIANDRERCEMPLKYDMRVWSQQWCNGVGMEWKWVDHHVLVST